MIWRPIFKKIATLEELTNVWTIDDLMDAHDLMDVIEEAETRAANGIASQVRRRK